MSPVPDSAVRSLSLREKLETLSRERDVLIALLDLTRSGLREGDTLIHRTNGTRGRLLVQRTGPAAGIMVQTADGKHCPFSNDWIGHAR